MARARLVPVLCPEPLALLGEWDSSDLAIVVDAVKSGGPPGEVTLHWLDEIVGAEQGPNRTRSSSHGLGVTDVWEISRLIGTAPTRAAIVGIEGTDFSLGRGLSSSVQAALPAAIAAVTEAIKAATDG